jgi:hypothetical protein
MGINYSVFISFKSFNFWTRICTDAHGLKKNQTSSLSAFQRKEFRNIRAKFYLH